MGGQATPLGRAQGSPRRARPTGRGRGRVQRACSRGGGTEKWGGPRHTREPEARVGADRARAEAAQPPARHTAQGGLADRASGRQEAQLLLATPPRSIGIARPRSPTPQTGDRASEANHQSRTRKTADRATGEGRGSTHKTGTRGSGEPPRGTGRNRTELSGGRPTPQARRWGGTASTHPGISRTAGRLIPLGRPTPPRSIARPGRSLPTTREEREPWGGGPPPGWTGPSPRRGGAARRGRPPRRGATGRAGPRGGQSTRRGAAVSSGRRERGRHRELRPDQRGLLGGGEVR